MSIRVCNRLEEGHLSLLSVIYLRQPIYPAQNTCYLAVIGLELTAAGSAAVHNTVQESISWGFRKLGVSFWGPHNTDYNIFKSILGSPYFGKQNTSEYGPQFFAFLFLSIILQIRDIARLSAM